MKTPRLLVLLTMLLIGADSPQPDLSLVEISPLDGTWDLVSVKVQGPGKLYLPNQRWVFAGRDWTCTYHGSNFKEKGTVKLGMAGKVQTVDLAESKFGIWKIRDGQLLILYLVNRKDRPRNFKGNGVLLTFK